MWFLPKLTIFPAIFFLLLFAIVGTDFVSNEYEEDGETEEAKDDDEDHVALFPAPRQGRVLCSHIRQVFYNWPTRMKMKVFLFLIYLIFPHF